MSAVAWLAEASPKVQQTTVPAGCSWSMPSRRARRSANAVPTAFGRCDAIVLVCGGTQRSRLPQTLCRPCEIGSSRLAQRLSRVSKIGVEPARLRARAIMNPPLR